METHPSAAFIHQISLWNTLWKRGKVEVDTVPEQGTPSPGVTGISPINKQDYKPPFRLPGEDSARAGKSIPALTHTDTGHQCCTLDSLPCSHQENVPAIINSRGKISHLETVLLGKRKVKELSSGNATPRAGNKAGNRLQTRLWIMWDPGCGSGWDPLYGSG